MSFRSILCSLCLLCFSAGLHAQDPPVDAAEISRDLLYHPATRIERVEGRVLFRAAQFTYRWDASSGQWEVTREKNDIAAESVTRYRHAATETEFRFAGSSTDDEGILEIFSGAETEPLVRLELWNRERLAAAWITRMAQDDSRLTESRLAEEAEPADPEVAGVADDGQYLWLAIRYYAGEGVLGIGTLVRLDPTTGETMIVQPADLSLSSLTHIVAANGFLWLGTCRQGEGAIEPTLGLVRYNPATGEVKNFLQSSPGIEGRMVTALLAAPEALWVATDAGICRLSLPGEKFTCWRIVPMVNLAAPLAASNRSGAAPRGRLPAGRYEVRWASIGFLEVVTPDAIEGWVETDDLEEYRRREFDQRPYELGNTYGGGAGAMRLLQEPGSDPLTAAQAFRVPLETVGEPSAEGWQRVRARVGWVARKGLEVQPVIQPAAN